jgi:hypothetical protein
LRRVPLNENHARMWPQESFFRSVRISNLFVKIWVGDVVIRSKLGDSFDFDFFALVYQWCALNRF